MIIKDAFSEKFQKAIKPIQEPATLPGVGTAYSPNIEQAAFLVSVAKTPQETAYAQRQLVEACMLIGDQVAAAILAKI